MLSARETVIEALLVIDREGRSLLLIERRQTLPFTPGALQRHAARDHGGDRQPRPDLIEERIGEFHWKQWACAARLGPQASAVHHHNSPLEQIRNTDRHVQRRGVENENGWSESLGPPIGRSGNDDSCRGARASVHPSVDLAMTIAAASSCPPRR